MADTTASTATGVTPGAAVTSGTGATPPGGQSVGNNGAMPANWDEWLQGQPEEIKTLAQTYSADLKSALSSEREQRKALAKELRDATAKAEQGSALQQTLTEINGRLENAERRAAFYEGAGPANCTNPRAAFLVAQAENLWRRDGTPDWAALQNVAPELFRKSSQVQAGAGTGAAPPARADMNAWIRRAAGRGA